MCFKKSKEQIIKRRKELYAAYVEEPNLKKKKRKWRRWQNSIPKGLKQRWHGLCQYDANLINLIMSALPPYGAFNLYKHLVLHLADEELRNAHPSTFIYDETHQKMGKHLTDVLCNNGLIKAFGGNGEYEVTDSGRKMKLIGSWEKFKQVEKLDFEASVSRNTRDKWWFALIFAGALFTLCKFVYEIYNQTHNKPTTPNIIQITHPSKPPSRLIPNVDSSTTK